MMMSTVMLGPSLSMLSVIWLIAAVLVTNGQPDQPHSQIFSGVIRNRPAGTDESGRLTAQPASLASSDSDIRSMLATLIDAVNDIKQRQQRQEQESQERHTAIRNYQEQIMTSLRRLPG